MHRFLAASSTRRRLLRTLIIGGGYLVACTAGLRPVLLFAAQRNKAAFDAKVLTETMKSIGASAVAESDQIALKAPEIAENGAIVPVEITSKLPETQAIYVVADKNPQPLVAIFDIAPGLEPFISTRIKMAESMTVRALVKANGKFYATSHEVKVTIGGCGG